MPPSSPNYFQARNLLIPHGELRAQPSSDWQGTFPLPAEIVTFYNQVGPVDVEVIGLGNPTSFPSLANLWKNQAGYRWHGITGDLNPDWNDDWLVIAHEGGDPYIFDLSSHRILFDFHGQRFWNPGPAFPSLRALVSTIAILGALIRHAALDPIPENSFTDDDSIVRPQHIHNAIIALTPILGSASAAQAALTRAGWTSSDAD